jgi:hypothetical protein
VCSITDLGVILDSKLSLESTLILSSTKVPYTLKVLYVTYVCYKLEYANCVWQPFYVTNINRIERIQKKFIKHALRQFRWNVNLDL